jgi:hypothetical protein
VTRCQVLEELLEKEEKCKELSSQSKHNSSADQDSILLSEIGNLRQELKEEQMNRAEEKRVTYEVYLNKSRLVVD